MATSMANLTIFASLHRLHHPSALPQNLVRLAHLVLPGSGEQIMPRNLLEHRIRKVAEFLRNSQPLALYSSSPAVMPSPSLPHPLLRASRALSVTACFMLAGHLAAAPAAPNYEKEIKPLLKARCYACHGALKQKAGAAPRYGRRRCAKAATTGTCLRTGSCAASRTSQHHRPGRAHATRGRGSALSAEEIAKLNAWIDAGRPRLRTNSRSRIRAGTGPIRLRSPPASLRSTHCSPHASRRTRPASRSPMPRRRSGCAASISISSACRRRRRRSRRFSRTPRAPAMSSAWWIACSPRRNTASAGARHFMDIWRYCDWYGLGAQLRHSQKHIWHWRDWIVESLNADKGYDQMIVEMLAADETRAGGSRHPARDRLSRAQLLPLQSHHLAGRDDRAHQPRLPRRDDAVREVPRPQVRSHLAGRLLPHARDLRAACTCGSIRGPARPTSRRTACRASSICISTRRRIAIVRGDEKNEDKTNPLPPGVPGVLEFASFQPEKVKLPRDGVSSGAVALCLAGPTARSGTEYRVCQSRACRGKGGLRQVARSGGHRTQDGIETDDP